MEKFYKHSNNSNDNSPSPNKQPGSPSSCNEGGDKQNLNGSFID